MKNIHSAHALNVGNAPTWSPQNIYLAGSRHPVDETLEEKRRLCDVSKCGDRCVGLFGARHLATFGTVYEALRNRPLCPRASNHSAPPAHFILLTDRLKTRARAGPSWVNLGYFRPNKFVQFLVLVF